MTASTLHPFKGRLSSLVQAMRDVRERNGAEPKGEHEVLFQNTVENMRECIERAHADVSWLEGVARDELKDLCGIFLTEVYNPPKS